MQRAALGTVFAAVRKIFLISQVGGKKKSLKGSDILFMNRYFSFL